MLCAVCPEISKCDRILQPPNGNRSGSHSLWLDSHGSDRLSGADFQALLLAHGGLTTLGANTFSMAIAGPVVSWGVYKLGRKIKLNQKVAVFLAAALGNLFTYCVTSVQLGLAHPAADGVWSAVVRFLGIFALTQIPLAVIEGLLTVVILIGLQTYAGPELRELGFGEENR